MKTKTRRRAAQTIAGLGVLATAAPFIGLGSRLPEPMASQWSWGGEPGSALPRVVLAAVLLAMALTGAVLVARSLGRREPSPYTSYAVGVGLGVGAFAAEIAWASTLCNLDSPSWSEARPLTWPVVIAMLAVAGGAIVAGRRLTRALDAPRHGAPLPSAGLPEGRTAVFLGGASAAAWKWGAALLIAAGALATLTAHLGLGLTLLTVGVALVPFSRISVRADREGVAIEYGPLHWPRQRIGLERISEAEVLDLRPLAHGGWGYRGSLALFGRAAVVVRGGEALVLHLAGGKRLTITVDDAQSAAGLINDLKQRAAEPRAS